MNVDKIEQQLYVDIDIDDLIASATTSVWGCKE